MNREVERSDLFAFFISLIYLSKVIMDHKGFFFLLRLYKAHKSIFSSVNYLYATRYSFNNTTFQRDEKKNIGLVILSSIHFI